MCVNRDANTAARVDEHPTLGALPARDSVNPFLHAVRCVGSLNMHAVVFLQPPSDCV